MTQKCRFCSGTKLDSFCDLGQMPPSNAYLAKPDQQEAVFPLHAYVCRDCLLVQLGQFQTPDEIFSQYQYFSSYSTSWIEHGRVYTEQVVERFHLTKDSFVVELASNDGYLLQHFLKKQIPLLGIEPAQNVAEIARHKGIDTLSQFFGLSLGKELAYKRAADLIIGNNVLAHVPDLNDFVSGIKALLARDGVVTLEFPHLQQLMAQNQFDTIYHEHFSYFSFFTVEKVFKHHGLEVFDVETLPTHGGSLRVYLQHCGGKQAHHPHVKALRDGEHRFGLDRLDTYHNFSRQVEKVKADLITFLQLVHATGKKVAAYGAPAKGNTLLNFCGISTALLPFTVDLNPHKQGYFLPGSRIPIDAPKRLEEFRPDYLLILPWNLKEEIQAQMEHVRSWGGKFVVPIPELAVQG